MENIILRNATPSDAEQILNIYAPYVENTAVSFEYDIPSFSDFSKRIDETIHSGYPYIVAVCDGSIIGFAYAAPFHTRAAFKHSVELSVYIQDDMRKKGVGRMLYSELERLLKEKGIKNLYACVAFAENEDEYLTHDSVIFHEFMGFKTVGKCNKCGIKFGRWYDMLYMEKFIGHHN